jgi:hypothetical protein
MMKVKLSEDQQDQVDSAIEHGIMERLWKAGQAKVLIKGDPAWDAVDQDLEYLTNLPSRFRGMGSVYERTVWGNRPVKVFYLQVGDTIEVFILSQMAYTMCTQDEIQWLLKEF